MSSANAGLFNEEGRRGSERSLEGLPTAISRPFMREGLCGAPETRADVQHKHEVTVPLPAGMEEGSIKQTCAIAFSSANAEPPHERGLYSIVTRRLFLEVLLNTVVETCIRHKQYPRLEQVLMSFQASGLRPSVPAYASLIKVCSCFASF